MRKAFLHGSSWSVLLAAAACLLMLSFTIRIMSDGPAKRISPRHGTAGKVIPAPGG